MTAYDWHKIANLKGRNYYLVGNQHITAAVQLDEAEVFSPLTVLIQDPEYFKKKEYKEYSYLFSKEDGLEPTRLEVSVNGHVFTANSSNLSVKAVSNDFIVEAVWWASCVRITERYFACQNVPTIVRQISLENKSDFSCDVCVSTGFCPNPIHFNACYEIPNGFMSCGNEFCIALQVQKSEDSLTDVFYKDSKLGFKSVLKSNTSVSNSLFYSFTALANKENIKDSHCIKTLDELKLLKEKRKKLAYLKIENANAQSVFDAAVRGLDMCSSYKGRVNAGVWQYNMEWTRDSSMVVLGKLHCGMFTDAKTILNYIFDNLVADDGRTKLNDSFVPEHLEQFDQAGQLLFATSQYYSWTLDSSFIKSKLVKISALCNRLCTSSCKDEQLGMFKNVREFWERSNSHGICEGYELVYQLWPVLGLNSICDVLDLFSDAMLQTKKWRSEAKRLYDSVFNNSKYSFILNDTLMKRVGLDGKVQDIITSVTKFRPDIPLSNDLVSHLNPDTVTTMPIIYSLIDPSTSLAHNTVDTLEILWNQRYETGGYARYNLSSEPDTPGGWCFASMFVARANLITGNHARAVKTIDWFATNEYSKSGVWFEYIKTIASSQNVGPIPWIWAEMAMFFVRDMLGIHPSVDTVRINPSIPNEYGDLRASIPIRDKVIHFNRQQGKNKISVGDACNNSSYKDGICVEVPKEGIDIKI